MQSELKNLIKNLDNLVVIICIILIIKYGYSGLYFIMETIYNVGSTI